MAFVKINSGWGAILVDVDLARVSAFLFCSFSLASFSPILPFEASFPLVWSGLIMLGVEILLFSPRRGFMVFVGEVNNDGIGAVLGPAVAEADDEDA